MVRDIAIFLPTVHIFETMRLLLIENKIILQNVFVIIFLNLFYLILSILFFLKMILLQEKEDFFLISENDRQFYILSHL